MKEQRWELNGALNMAADYSLIFKNFQFFIFDSLLSIKHLFRPEVISIDFQSSLLNQVQVLDSGRLEIAVCGLNYLFVVELQDFEIQAIRKYSLKSAILYFELVDADNVAVVSNDEVCNIKLGRTLGDANNDDLESILINEEPITDHLLHICDHEAFVLKDYALFGLLPKDLSQVIGITSVSHKDTTLLITIDVQAQLKIWNLFTLACLKTIELAKVQLQTIPSKLMVAFDVNESNDGFSFGLVVHVPLDYKPAFALMEIKLDNSGVLTDSNLQMIDSANDLVDFAIFLKGDRYIMEAVFLDSLQYMWLDQTPFKWHPHQPLLKLQSADLQISNVYSKCSQQTVATALELEELEWFDDQRCQTLILDYIHQKTCESLADGTMDQSYMNETSERLDDYQREYVKQTHLILARLVDSQNNYDETLSVSFDESMGLTLLSKRGGSIGFLREKDVVEHIAIDSFKDTLLAPATFFHKRWSVLKNFGVRNAIFNFTQLVDYITSSLISFDDAMDVITELPLIISHEQDLDEFSRQVFERIRDIDPEQGETLDEQTSRVRFLSSKVGSLDSVLKELLTVFQHLNLSPDFTEHQNYSLTNMVAETFAEIIAERFDFIKHVYLTLCVLKHMPLSNIFSITTFGLWQSLTCCYARLNWLRSLPFISKPTCMKQAKSEGKSLLSFLIHQHIPFDAMMPLEENLPFMALSVLEKLGWSVAYPISSLEESNPIIKLAKTMLIYCPPQLVQELLDFLPSPTPAYSVLMGQTWLALYDYPKAKKWFSLGVAGAGAHNSNLSLVLPAEACENSRNYYEYVRQLCADRGVFDLAVHFGRLAISNTQNCDGLKQNVFAHALECCDFRSAYDLLYQIEDSVIMRDCLRLLVGELCHQKEISLLVSTFSFSGLTVEVEDTLQFKSRNEVCNLQAESSYYKICYSYFTYRGDYRRAADVMYQHALKLSAMQYFDKISDQVLGNVLTQISQCLLTALGSLSLVEKSSAYLTVHQPKTAFDEMPYDESKPIRIVEVDCIRKEYHLSMAKLSLYTKVSSLKSFKLPDDEDIYTIYCTRFMFDSAIQTALLFNKSLEKVIEYVTVAITNTIHNRPW